MENLIFAFNAVAPSFCIVILGNVLKRRGFLTEDFVTKGNQLCFNVLFPLLVFFNLYDAVSIDFTYIKIILFCIGVIFISVGVLTVSIPRFVKDRRKIGVMIQCIYRGNFMLYGLPFSKALGGTQSLTLATSIMAATLPILNIMGIFVYAAFADTAEKPSVKKAVFNALKNPIIWGVILGLIFYILKLPMPSFLHTSGNDVAKIATPLAFLFLGAQFEFRTARRNMKELAIGLIAKLIVVPTIFLWLAVHFLHLSGAELIPVFIFVSAPTAITNYQLAIQFEADYELAGDYLIYSMIFSAFTLFFFIYVLRNMGLI
ncbi:membrane transport protein [Anaerotignum neopropionicum]|uniref:Membrane transport protein n=1 Tax=Anaerotignum neopropionicum TaxID=36847 RepID=A0A136WDF7_9FIRM|nr:AEC family transporter [Anaerotignum neopropionicum]KXL52369.1 membrane transport protein [Anaerotignum neopropionicum]